MDTRQDLIKWLAGRDTGASSKAIVNHMETGEGGQDYPLDGWDFGRCIRLLGVMPSYRSRLSEMAKYGKKWEVLVAHWDELEIHYNAGLQPPHRMDSCHRLILDLIEKANELSRDECKQRGSHNWLAIYGGWKQCKICGISEVVTK